MTVERVDYLLSQASNEIERLQSWAKSWQPETEAMLDLIHIQPGWRCLDLACGPVGITESLSRRVGPGGQVVGADLNVDMLNAARSYANLNHLTNLEFVETDAFQTKFECETFDLVHARFMFAPLGRTDTLLTEMIALTRPGGVVVSQESDESSYVCYPPQPAWERLKQITVAAFSRGGGDYSAGRRTYNLWRQSGLVDVHARAAALALPAGHPYRRWPIESAQALRARILDWKLIGAAEFDQLLADCEGVARDPDIFLTSFAVMQVWGRKPG